MPKWCILARCGPQIGYDVYIYTSDYYILFLAQAATRACSHTVRIHIVNMETTIVRANTVEESRVEHVLPNGVETDEILLHAWNSELAPSVERLDRLDTYHLLWYKFMASFHVLVLGVHFSIDNMDRKIVVSGLNVLTYIHYNATAMKLCIYVCVYVYFSGAPLIRVALRGDRCNRCTAA